MWCKLHRSGCLIEEQKLRCIVVTLVYIWKKAYKWIPIQTAYVYTIICMPNLFRPVQFGQALAEITDYSIGMMVFQNHKILQLRDVSRRQTTTSEKSNIAGGSLVSPEFTALSLFFSPRVERALLRRTKNLTSRPWRWNDYWNSFKRFKFTKSRLAAWCIW